MIYTLTANPAIDYNIACDGLTANTVTRTRNAVYTPNGKGLNVSFTLDHYGVDTTILGFFAGFSGEFIVKGAEALGVPVKPVWTDGITRVNVFLNAGPDTEYNMVNAGAAINEANEQEMFELIDSLDDMTCLGHQRLAASQHFRGLLGRGPAPCQGQGGRVRPRHLEPSAGRPHCSGATADQAQ